MVYVSSNCYNKWYLSEEIFSSFTNRKFISRSMISLNLIFYYFLYFINIIFKYVKFDRRLPMWFYIKKILFLYKINNMFWKVLTPVWCTIRFLYSPVIISMNSSKSTVPEPSESISSIIMSNSSLVSWSSSSLKISFRHDVGI